MHARRSHAGGRAAHKQKALREIKPVVGPHSFATEPVIYLAAVRRDRLAVRRKLDGSPSTRGVSSLLRALGRACITIGHGAHMRKWASQSVERSIDMLGYRITASEKSQRFKYNRTISQQSNSVLLVRVLWASHSVVQRPNLSLRLK